MVNEGGLDYFEKSSRVWQEMVANFVITEWTNRKPSEKSIQIVDS